MSSQSVLVIGGGLAGLASSVALADAGCTVRLLEKRPHLGGRATSYTLPDGSEIDNCQHVTLGCCTNLTDFYRRVNAADKIRYYDRLYFADRRGRRSAIEASSWLPPPFHMSSSFVFFHGLTLADKRAIANALLVIARAGGAPPRDESLSMLAWLQQKSQTPGAIAKFWRPVLVSALDEDLDRMGARYGIDVFWKAFLANRGGYRFGIPQVPLADLYEGCRDSIVRRGGEVRLRSTVREIVTRDGAFAGARLDDGSELCADVCISAVPQNVLPGLLSQFEAQENSALGKLGEIQTSPITGVHFWFDRTVMAEPFLALLDHKTQWIFNKSLLSKPGDSREGKSPPGNTPLSGGQYLQLVISASYDLVPLSRQEIIDLCHREVMDVLPAARTAKLEKATVVKEIHATFSPAPGVDRWRLPQETNVRNLFFAGDWTLTGWPSTMEGAVRSGYLAAEAVLKHVGAPAKLVQPDLPPEGLSARWARRAAGKIAQRGAKS
jgi:squalene-associated FAD-dependent desaturase